MAGAAAAKPHRAERRLPAISPGERSGLVQVHVNEEMSKQTVL